MKMKLASVFLLSFIVGIGCTGILRSVLREARSELDGGRECYVVECRDRMQCGGYQDLWAAQFDPACRVLAVECVCFECARRAQRVSR